MRRAVSIFAACALSCTLAVPVYAADAERVLRFDKTLQSTHSEQLEAHVLTGISATREGTTHDKVLSAVTADSEHAPVLMSADGTPLQAGAVVSTGMKVCALHRKTGQLKDEHVLIVAGDVTGTGKLTLTQLVRLSDAVSGKKPLEPVFALAADRSGNGKVDLTDLVMQASELAASAPAPSQAPVSTLQPPDVGAKLTPNVLLGRMQQQFLLKVDRARTQAGLPAAKQSTLLDQAAQAMAEKISETGKQDAVSMENVLNMTGEHWQNTTQLAAYNGIEGVSAGAMKVFENEGTAPLEEKIGFTGVGVARNAKGVWTVVQLYTENEPSGWKNGAMTSRGWNTDVLGGTENKVGTANGIPQKITDVRPVYKNDTKEEARKMINAGMLELMQPYAYNTTSTDGYDCSGFVYYALKEGGANVHRDSSGGYAVNEDWQTIERMEDLKTGDLLFFGEPDSIFHVGIYIGDGLMLHAAPSIGGVGYNMIESGYYHDNFAWGKRVF